MLNVGVDHAEMQTIASIVEQKRRIMNHPAGVGFIKLAFFIAAWVLLCGYPVSCFMMTRVRVWVHNDISPDTDMIIHCKSKDDDLGEHNIPYKGNFTWKFHDNWDQTTLFWCRIGYWDDKAEKLVSGAFDIYKESRDNLVCYATCPRWVRTDGIYMWNQLTKKIPLGYRWPNSSVTSQVLH